MVFDTKYNTQFGAYDRQKAQKLEQVRSQIIQISKLKQFSFTKSIYAGLLTAVVGIFLWAVLANIVSFSTNFVTIGIALWVALAVKRASMSNQIKFGFVGIFIMLAVCTLAPPTIAYVSSSQEVQFQNPFILFVQNYWNSLELIDYFYFSVALFCSFKYSRYAKKFDDTYRSSIFPPVE